MKDNILNITRRDNVATSQLCKELKSATYLGSATHCRASIYSFSGGELRGLMTEVGRLRRESFEAVGVSMPECEAVEASDRDGTYRQLIVWDDEERAIIGGYRYAVGRDVVPEKLSMGRYFRLTPRFSAEYLPRSIELGRSFIQSRYQCGHNAKTIFALDALWEGLARVVERECVDYLVGRVTFYPSLGVRARNLLIGFMRYVFPERESLVAAHTPLRGGMSHRWLRRCFVGCTPKENYRILISRMRSMRRSVPPIISSYMRLSPSMQTFDLYRNDDLGGVAECGIMLTIADLYDDVKRRYFSF
ncbi:MAG: GNAT family N-acetyltransferase [Alistipes sp.]|nr:GNAT family N-acetyltransferase [Alistipes sp.]